MKKQLLALSMVTASGLLANADTSNQSQQQSCYCNTCCCDPCCCIPKPKKCIDCECYTPAFYDLQCDWGFSFDAEFLYWYARETNLAYAAKIQAINVDTLGGTPNRTVLANQSYAQLGAAWGPGFRVGVGCNDDCDGWDYNLTWTWLCNSKTNQVSVDKDYLYDQAIDLNGFGNPFFPNPGESALINPWINASFDAMTRPFNGGPVGMTFDKVSAKYRLRFNQIDLDVGRKYWLSACFNLRPYTGLRGYWTKAKFRTVSSRNFSLSGTDFFLTFKDRFRTTAWGVGIIGGFEPTWYFSRCFALYAKTGAALLWGDFKVKKEEKYFWSDIAIAPPAPPVPAAVSSAKATSSSSVGSSCDTSCTPCDPPQYTASGRDRYPQMTGMLDLAIGLRWETTWCCDRYMTALDLGWEDHILLDQNHRFQTRDVVTLFPGGLTEPQGWGYSSYDEAAGNLGLGGFVLRLNVDF